MLAEPPKVLLLSRSALVAVPWLAVALCSWWLPGVDPIHVCRPHTDPCVALVACTPCGRQGRNILSWMAAPLVVLRLCAAAVPLVGLSLPAVGLQAMAAALVAAFSWPLLKAPSA